MRLFRGLPVLFFFTAVAACAPDDAAPIAADDHDVTGTAVANKKALFEGDFYYARVANDELSMWKADPKSGAHCPDGETSDAKLVYKTKKFSVRTSGNMTRDTPKS